MRVFHKTAFWTAMCAFALLLVPSIQSAQAGGQGESDYYSTSYDADDYDDGFEGRIQNMMDQMGNVFADFYLAARGTLALHDATAGSDPDGGRADLSGYYGSGLFDAGAAAGDPRVPQSDATSFGTILNSYTTDLEPLAGGFQVAAGYDVPLVTPLGGFRGEFEYAFQTYANEVCFLDLTGTGDNAPTQINVPVPGLEDTAAARTADNTLRAATSDDGDAAREALRGAAREALRGGSSTQCQDQDSFVHRFLFNAFYDVNLGDIMDLMGMSAGIAGGLNFHLGAGVGYALTESTLEDATIAPDVNEPIFNPSAPTADAVPATGTNPAVPAGTVPITFGADADCAGTLPSPAPADCGANSSSRVAAPDVLESGLVVPVYGGFSYSLAELTGFPVMTEFTYRYDVVAPDNLGSHGFLFGVRYHF